MMLSQTKTRGVRCFSFCVTIFLLVICSVLVSQTTISNFKINTIQLNPVFQTISVDNKESRGEEEEEGKLYPFSEKKSSTFQSNNQTKYLQYFVQGGWGNQFRCLSNAYLIAWATQRTLILAPVVPHFHLKHNHIHPSNEEFQVNYDLQNAYNPGVSKDERKGNGMSLETYLRLDQVLDIASSMPSVPYVDYLDFYSQYVGNSRQNLSTWVMEEEYNHLNTIWVYREPSLLGHTWNASAIEHQVKVKYNTVVRDLEEVSQKHQESTVWTLLDSFRAPVNGIKGWKGAGSLRNLAAESDSAMRPRLSSSIRHVSQEVLRIRGFHEISYVTIHIRGSDGPFKQPAQIGQSISSGISDATDLFQTFLSSNDTIMAAAETNMTNHSQRTTTTTAKIVGLFVMTDLTSLDSLVSFQYRLSRLQQHLKSHYGVTLKVILSPMILETLEGMKNQTNIAPHAAANIISSSFPYNDVETLSIFVEQQMAICSSIGFIKNQKSTFSSLIQEFRKNQTHACATS